MAEVATLKEEATWRQGDFVEDRGWVTLAGMAEAVAEARDPCAERPAVTEPPPAKKVISVNNNATTVQ